MLQPCCNHVATMLDDKLRAPAHFAIHYILNLKTSDACISRFFDLNDINFGRVVKIIISKTFKKFGPVAPNLHKGLVIINARDRGRRDLNGA